MRTSATNRKIGRLMNEIREERLIPQPGFQRRLVWANKHKIAFLQTVLRELPFPEIYIAIGELDTETGASRELLVDGQQRMTTLYQYFSGSPDLKLTKDVPPYARLSPEQKRQFLEYEVVIRDLGNISMDQVKEVFERINSTRYSLTAMEVHNARFEGEFKQLGEELAAESLFEKHRVFSSTDVRRMEDVKYCLVLAATMMGTYFNRDDDLEDYLKRHNDELPGKAGLIARIRSVFSFLENAQFPETSRVWKKADFFTATIEIDQALMKGLPLRPAIVRSALQSFYAEVDAHAQVPNARAEVGRYYLSALQASNDRVSRVTRGEIIQRLLRDSVNIRPLFGESLGPEQA